MKRMLVALTIVVFASVSFAGLEWQVSKDRVLAGETVTISLVDTDGEGFASILMDVITDYGAGGLASNLAIAPFASFPDAGYVGTGANLIEWVGGSADDNQLEGLSGVLYSFDYTVSDLAPMGLFINIGASTEGVNLASYVSMANGEAGPIDDAVLEVIPEPMTMALLGLGGLFLRRRRA